MKNILVPIDFSSSTLRVIEEAAALARAVSGRLILLNVTTPQTLVADHAAFLRLFVEIEEPAATSRLGRLFSEAPNGAASALAGDSLQVMGEPTHDIVAEARRVLAGYIVIGSHAYSPADDDPVGHVVTAVVGSAVCPVLIVAQGARLRRFFSRAPTRSRVKDRPSHRLSR